MRPSLPTQAATGKTAIFLHVATLGRYDDVANEVLKAVASSPLAGTTDVVSVGVVGSGPLNLDSAGLKLDIHRLSDDVQSFEFPTLGLIWSFAKANPDHDILYLNCLGGRHTGDGWHMRRQWRKMLYFVLLDQHETCTGLLKSNDVVGVRWVVSPLGHMTSNNWWARATYVAHLSDPAGYPSRVAAHDLSRHGDLWSDPHSLQRHSGEFWIGSGPDCKPVSLLDYRRLGIPQLDRFGTAPWWGMPGISWIDLARMQFGLKTAMSDRIRLKTALARFSFIFTCRDIKHRLRRWQRQDRLRR